MEIVQNFLLKPSSRLDSVLSNISKKSYMSEIRDKYKTNKNFNASKEKKVEETQNINSSKNEKYSNLLKKLYNNNVIKNNNNNSLESKNNLHNNEVSQPIKPELNLGIEKQLISPEEKKEESNIEPTVDNPNNNSERNAFLYIDVSLSTDKSDRIIVYENDKSEDLAREFALKHSIFH